MEIPLEIGISPTLGIRGLVAARDLTEGELIEACPLVLIPVTQEEALEQTALSVYYFLWTDEHYCLALGYGSLYNHSYHANVRFIHDYDKRQIVFRAARNISKSEELTVNYNGDPNDPTPIHPDFLR